MMTELVRPSLRDDPAVRRMQIVDEAVRLIGRHGFNGFKIQQLARHCGLTNGGVLYHFPSKEHLLAAVVDEVTRRDGEAISARISHDIRASLGGASSIAAVTAILRLIVSHSSAHPDLARLLAMLRAEAIDPDHPAHAQLQVASRRALERYRALFEPISPDPLSMARRVDALMNGLTVQWLCEAQSFDLLAEWDRAIAAIFPGERG